MHRQFLTFYRNTHIAQKLAENYLDKLQKFLSYKVRPRNKNSYELYEITNINETPFYLNIPASTTVQTIEPNKVNIKS